MKPVIGHYAFHPLNEAHIIGGNGGARLMLADLAKACGWKVRLHGKRKTKNGKHASRKTSR